MPKKHSVSAAVHPDTVFVKELAGETPPSFAAMKQLYELASVLFSLRPWQTLDESQLMVVRDSASGELCYCSVMGALGQVFSMHAYIGAEGLRQFRKLEAGEIADPGEYRAALRCVYVEFVSRAELQRQDRELLAALDHPRGKGLAAPIFRSIRPGFYPWFVSAEEARILAECMRAVIAICRAIAGQTKVDFWDKPDHYPMVTCLDEAGLRYQVDLVKAILPPEPAIAAVNLPEEKLNTLRFQNYTVGSAMELDYIFQGVPIGKSSERKACASLVLAVDAEIGIIYALEATDARVPQGEALAAAFLQAIQASRLLPKEIRVRRKEHKTSLAPLMESFGVKLSVAARLPGADDARAHLLEFLHGKR